MVKREHLGYRGLAREKLNSDFMRLKNYEVIDNPEQKPDGLNPLKQPEHRIDGTIFDSYAPRHSIRNWDWLYADPESEFKLWERCKSDLSPQEREKWQSVQRGLIQKGIAGKIDAGQTRNILLNLSDTSDEGQVLCNKELADMLCGVKNLESIVCIFPKKGGTTRGFSSGKGETWKNHIPSDMEAVQWIRGRSGFCPLPDGKCRRGDEDEQNESEDDSEPDNKPRAEEDGIGVGSDNGSGFSIPSALGILSLVIGFLGVLAWLSGLFGGTKKVKKRDSKSRKCAVAIYRRYMNPVVIGLRNKPQDLLAAHEDLKTVVVKILSPRQKDLSEIEKWLDSEYDDLTSDHKVYTFLEIFSSNPFYETFVMFMYYVSRFVSSLITMATKEVNESHRVIGMHVSLLVTALLGQRLLHLVFLGMLAGPLKFIYYLCMVSFTVLLVQALTGFGACATSAISQVSNILWENTERSNVSSSKLTLPKRAAVILFGMVLLTLLGRLFKSLGIASTVFKAPAMLFTPFIFLVKVLKYFELFVKLTWIFFASLAILLLVLVVQMAWPSGMKLLSDYLNKQYHGYSVNNVADGFWKEMETFINLKPTMESG